MKLFKNTKSNSCNKNSLYIPDLWINKLIKKQNDISN